MITKSKLAPQSPLPTTLPYVGGQLSGSTVCFTGTLMSKRNGTLITRDEAEQLARAAGLIPVSGVTKKTQILVIADPDSMSGKAKKAREYGTRIMAESVFWNAIGVQVE
jgi:DNA polymerase III subunit epsilon